MKQKPNRWKPTIYLIKYAELEARLEHYVELAGKGKKFVVFRHNQPWMQLSPLAIKERCTA